MEVKIKPIHETDILTYNLDPKSTILNLKEKIADEEGLEIDRQRLFYNFVLLSDEIIYQPSLQSHENTFARFCTFLNLLNFFQE